MRESQCERILRALRNGAVLTHRDASRMFDCDRLGGRIYDLRQRGYNIETEMVTTRSGKRIARYWMAE